MTEEHKVTFITEGITDLEYAPVFSIWVDFHHFIVAGEGMFRLAEDETHSLYSWKRHIA